MTNFCTLQAKSEAITITSSLFSPPGEVTLKLLDLELQEVSEWFRLGLCLDIPPPKLYDIKCDSALRCVQDFRTKMLSVWTRMLPGPSWSRVVKALMEVGRETLAHRIADKYGTCILLKLKVLYMCLLGNESFSHKRATGKHGNVGTETGTEIIKGYGESEPVLWPYSLHESQINLN